MQSGIVQPSRTTGKWCFIIIIIIIYICLTKCMQFDSRIGLSNVWFGVGVQWKAMCTRTKQCSV